MLAAALALAGCAGAGRYSASAVPVQAERAAALVSAYRRANGLGEVAEEARLMQAAQSYALAIAGAGRLSHELGGTVAKRVRRTGYRYFVAAENLGAGYASLDAAMDGWTQSAGHRVNLLNPDVAEIGIGAADAPGTKLGRYWVLILAAPRAGAGGR